MNVTYCLYLSVGPGADCTHDRDTTDLCQAKTAQLCLRQLESKATQLRDHWRGEGRDGAVHLHTHIHTQGDGSDIMTYQSRRGFKCNRDVWKFPYMVGSMNYVNLWCDLNVFLVMAILVQVEQDFSHLTSLAFWSSEVRWYWPKKRSWPINSKQLEKAAEDIPVRLLVVQAEGSVVWSISQLGIGTGAGRGYKETRICSGETSSICTAYSIVHRILLKLYLQFIFISLFDSDNGQWIYCTSCSRL